MDSQVGTKQDMTNNSSHFDSLRSIRTIDINLANGLVSNDLVDIKVGRLLLRPTDSSDINRLAAPRYRSNLKRDGGQQNEPTRSGLPESVTWGGAVHRAASNLSSDYGHHATDSDLDRSMSSRYSSISDINSFDDGASIASRLSRIVIEQEDKLEQHRKSLSCIPQATSCFGPSLSPTDMTNGKEEPKRRLSLCVPSMASSIVRGSLRNLATLTTSISNLSISSYDRDIEATMKHVRTSAASGRRRSSLGDFGAVSTGIKLVETMEEKKIPITSTDSVPTIEILHDADTHVGNSHEVKVLKEPVETCNGIAQNSLYKEQPEQITDPGPIVIQPKPISRDDGESDLSPESMVANLPMVEMQLPSKTSCFGVNGKDSGADRKIDPRTIQFSAVETRKPNKNKASWYLCC